MFVSNCFRVITQEKDVIGEEAEAELKKIKFGATNSSFVRRVDEEAEDARLQQLRSKTKPLALPKKKKKKSKCLICGDPSICVSCKPSTFPVYPLETPRHTIWLSVYLGSLFPSLY